MASSTAVPGWFADTEGAGGSTPPAPTLTLLPVLSVAPGTARSPQLPKWASTAVGERLTVLSSGALREQDAWLGPRRCAYRSGQVRGEGLQTSDRAAGPELGRQLAGAGQVLGGAGGVAVPA